MLIQRGVTLKMNNIFKFWSSRTSTKGSLAIMLLLTSLSIGPQLLAEPPSTLDGLSISIDSEGRVTNLSMGSGDTTILFFRGAQADSISETTLCHQDRKYLMNAQI